VSSQLLALIFCDQRVFDVSRLQFVKSTTVSHG